MTVFPFLASISQTQWAAMSATASLVSALALIFTLIWVAGYTKATKAMANATKSMADAQMAMTDLQRRPVLAVGCGDESAFRFKTLFKNFSSVHARAKIKATIVVNGKTMKMPPGHYDLTKVWQVQAVGPFGPTFGGHLSFDDVFRYNNMDFPPESTVDAHVTLESWVINFDDPEEELDMDENKNPVAHWDWNTNTRRWVPEIAPAFPSNSDAERPAL